MAFGLVLRLVDGRRPRSDRGPVRVEQLPAVAFADDTVGFAVGAAAEFGVMPGEGAGLVCGFRPSRTGAAEDEIGRGFARAHLVLFVRQARQFQYGSPVFGLISGWLVQCTF